MPVICIHVESPPSSDAEPGTVTITGWQRLLWIGCLSCYLLGQQQRWPSMQLLLGLSHWQADVFRIPCTLVTKARPANRKPGASAPALLLPPPLLWVWVKLRQFPLWVRDGESHDSVVPGNWILRNSDRSQKRHWCSSLCVRGQCEV